MRLERSASKNDLNKRMVEIHQMIRASAVVASEEKERIIKQMNEVTKERNKSAADYNKIK